MRLHNKIALITGAGSGIGKAMALLFAKEGAHVVVTDINASTAAATAREIHGSGGKASHHALDASNGGQVEAVYAEVARCYGRLDIQLSHAGITYRTPFLDVSLTDFDHIIRVNLYGTLLCGQAAARLMIAGGIPGRIVNTTSVSGLQGGTGRAAYGASKAAIINLTQTMAIELASHGILVNAIAPGPTRVERTAHGPKQQEAFLSRLAIKRYAQPDDIAQAALFLASGENTYVTGHVLNVDGGFAAAGVMFDPAGGEAVSNR